MTQPVQCVGVFCDDVRLEATDQITLVGILSDYMSVPGTPGALAKLGFYARVHSPVDLDPRPITLNVKLPNGERQEIGTVDDAAVLQNMADSKASGLPFCGYIFHGVFSPFPVPHEGRVELIVAAAGQEFTAATLTFREQPNT